MLVELRELMRNSGVYFGTSGARGLVTKMTDEVCYAYTAAFLKVVCPAAKRVVLGHDLRPSSPRIAAACAQAISDDLCEIIYAGAMPTPALAYYALQLNAPAIVVTGSHTPFDRNGIKFYRADGEISKADELAIQTAIADVPTAPIAYVLGQPDLAAQESYVTRYLDFFGSGAFKGLTVGVYEHSSVARDLLRTILLALGAEVTTFGRTDLFVPIDTEAVRAEDVAQAKRWAKDHHFDALLSTDGDADRPLIGDESGEWLRGDVVGILCAQYLKADVVVTPLSSNTAVEKCGAFRKVIRTRIGSPYVIAAMQPEIASDEGVVVGYEANGGFLLGSDLEVDGRLLGALPTRDAVLPMLALLAMFVERGCKLSDLSMGLPARFTASDRIRDFSQEKSSALIKGLIADQHKMRDLMAPGSGTIANIDTTDGLRVTFSNGHIVHLRPSGNAPELRCYAEADTQQASQNLCFSCLKRLQG